MSAEWVGIVQGMQVKRGAANHSLWLVLNGDTIGRVASLNEDTVFVEVSTRAVTFIDEKAKS